MVLLNRKSAEWHVTAVQPCLLGTELIHMFSKKVQCSPSKLKKVWLEMILPPALSNHLSNF